MGLLTFALIALALAAAYILNPLRQSHAASSPTPHASPPLFGANMALFDSHDQLLQNAATQQLLKQQGMAIIRMPFRSTLPDDVEVAALQSIKNVGAAPLVIVHGATDANVTQDDAHLLQLTQSVFGSSTVYVEFGNEEDLAGVDVTRYTAAWNATVPKLKAMAPTYKFIGPVNFQYNPGYIATFDKNASPRPDFNSWHEYVCNTSESDSYCLSHIANWSTHIAQTNQAVQAAIGSLIPIMITEWNLDPQQDPRYTNSAYMRQWTQSALDTLVANSVNGVVAAMQYVATNNQGFDLIDANNQPTAQGQTLFAALAQARASGGQSTPTQSTTTAATTPTQPVANAPNGSTSGATSAATATGTAATPKVPASATPVAGVSTLFTFDDGATHGWQANGSQIVALRGVRASATTTGALQMQLSGLTAQTYPYVSVRTHLTTVAGPRIVFNVFVPAGVGSVMARPYVMSDSDYQWIGPNRYQTLQPGWNQVMLSAPSDLANTTIQLGLQLMAHPGSIVNGSVYIHSVEWSK